MIGGRHRSNMELVAQGAANILTPLFGGMPATGAIARTATNVKNGGRTPVAGIFHALVLLLIMVLFGRWAALIPLPALAAILAVVAFNMSEWRTFKALMRSPRSDIAVLLLTFSLTVAVDLTVAIETGMIVSMMLFMKNMSESVRVRTISRALRGEHVPEAEPEVWSKEKFPPGVEAFDVQGPLFFGAAQRFEETLAEIGSKPKAVLIRIREVRHIDATGLHALEQFGARCRKQGIPFILVGVPPETLSVLERSGSLEVIGRENLVPTLNAALGRLESPAPAA
jgi:SulP family sulfate permease